ncbi:MAG: DUF4625 domain-containing protein [Flavobacterium sp.]|nr:DUF4625 domain-containing protein [Flavobacterium sp.]
MKNIKYLYAFATIAALSFTSCSSDSDDKDTEKPTITITEPVTEEGFTPGSEIHLEGVLTDNVELASYKVEVHSAEDGHTHGKMAGAEAASYFHYEQTFPIEAGLRIKEFHQHIPIPALDANGQPFTDGHYHLGVFCLDKAGNQQQVFLEIYIGADGGDHGHDHKSIN